MSGEYIKVTVDAINAMLGIVALIMASTTMGFFTCYFLVKKEYKDEDNDSVDF